MGEIVTNTAWLSGRSVRGRRAVTQARRRACPAAEAASFWRRESLRRLDVCRPLGHAWLLVTLTRRTGTHGQSVCTAVARADTSQPSVHPWGHLLRVGGLCRLCPWPEGRAFTDQVAGCGVDGLSLRHFPNLDAVRDRCRAVCRPVRRLTLTWYAIGAESAMCPCESFDHYHDERRQLVDHCHVGMQCLERPSVALPPTDRPMQGDASIACLQHTGLAGDAMPARSSTARGARPRWDATPQPSVASGRRAPLQSETVLRVSRAAAMDRPSFGRRGRAGYRSR